MKRSTVRLLLVSALLYALLLFALSSIYPSNIAPPLILLVVPLTVLIVILVRDLFSKATIPSGTRSGTGYRRLPGREVRSLRRQIDVATQASPAYFDSVLLSRLREILAERVSLETGIEKNGVSEVLKNRVLGPRLVKDERLYRLLYIQEEAAGTDRLNMLREAIGRIEEWKA